MVLFEIRMKSFEIRKHGNWDVGIFEDGEVRMTNTIN